MFFDSYGLIVQSNGDSGDCPQRLGFYHSALNIRKILGISNEGLQRASESDFDCALQALTVNGQLVRHPIQYPDPKDVSRDQVRPIIIALGFYKASVEVLDLYKPKHGFYPNLDVETPQHRNELKRAEGCQPSSLGDLFASVDMRLRVYLGNKNADDVGDDLNVLLGLTQGFLIKPTPRARKNLKYYLEHRNVMLALRWYFRAESGGNPELAEVWAPIIEKLKR